jgi:hypothetical protein
MLNTPMRLGDISQSSYTRTGNALDHTKESEIFQQSQVIDTEYILRAKIHIIPQISHMHIHSTLCSLPYFFNETLLEEQEELGTRVPTLLSGCPSAA